jgi:predicted TIM-barrel fold metal-dependent hydrolase
MRTKAAAVNGIETILVNNIPAKYPKLRFGCIEAGASWVSFVDYDLRRRVQSRANRVSILGGPNTILASNLFKNNRVYITCQVDEDLPYILKYVGEDNLIVGSDYTHRDPSMELEFRSLLQQRADEGEIPQSAVEKILYDNPKAFYGISSEKGNLTQGFTAETPRPQREEFEITNLCVLCASAVSSLLDL